MMRKRPHDRHQTTNPSAAETSRRGAALVECAVTLPVLLTLVLGTIELGTALKASTVLQSSCREAGRLAAMDWRYVVEATETPNEKVEQDLRNFITASGLPGDDLVVRLLHADGEHEGQTFDLADPDNELELIRIEVELPYSSISLFPTNYLHGTALKGFVIMRAGLSAGSLSD